MAEQPLGGRVSTGAELHEVVGSRANGSAGCGTNLNGKLRFQLLVTSLSGAPTSAHIHGPATPTENAGVIVTLCGAGPGIPVVSTYIERVGSRREPTSFYCRGHEAYHVRYN